jgi:Putative lumazine-binding
MTLLLLQNSRNWVVISVVVTNKTPSTPVTSSDFQGPLKICWDDYCTANRACDGGAMAKVFHPSCRLTYSSSAHNDDSVVVKSSAEFCRMVTGRYDMEPMHMPYAAYRDDPAAAAGDTLQGVSMISPTLALVRLKVGHPPCLWSDLLVCAKVLDQWWIVAKSSSSESFIIGPRAT